MFRPCFPEKKSTLSAYSCGKETRWPSNLDWATVCKAQCCDQPWGFYPDPLLTRGLWWWWKVWSRACQHAADGSLVLPACLGTLHLLLVPLVTGKKRERRQKLVLIGKKSVRGSRSWFYCGALLQRPRSLKHRLQNGSGEEKVSINSLCGTGLLSLRFATS